MTKVHLLCIALFFTAIVTAQVAPDKQQISVKEKVTALQEEFKLSQSQVDLITDYLSVKRRLEEQDVSDADIQQQQLALKNKLTTALPDAVLKEVAFIQTVDAQTKARGNF